VLPTSQNGIVKIMISNKLSVIGQINYFNIEKKQQPLTHLYIKKLFIQILTYALHSLKTSFLMMLHRFSAQVFRCGCSIQRSFASVTSGHVSFNFQLFPNSSESVTTSPLCFIKSLFALPSKFPHSPHTLPCHRDQVDVYAST